MQENKYIPLGKTYLKNVYIQITSFKIITEN